MRQRAPSAVTPFNAKPQGAPPKLKADGGWAGKSPAEFTAWLRKREAERDAENQTAYRRLEGNASS